MPLNTNDANQIYLEWEKSGKKYMCVTRSGEVAFDDSYHDKYVFCTPHVYAVMYYKETLTLPDSLKLHFLVRLGYESGNDIVVEGNTFRNVESVAIKIGQMYSNAETGRITLVRGFRRDEYVIQSTYDYPEISLVLATCVSVMLRSPLGRHQCTELGVGREQSGVIT